MGITTATAKPEGSPTVMSSKKMLFIYIYLSQELEPPTIGAVFRGEAPKVAREAGWWLAARIDARNEDLATRIVSHYAKVSIPVKVRETISDVPEGFVENDTKTWEELLAERYAKSFSGQIFKPQQKRRKGRSKHGKNQNPGV